MTVAKQANTLVIGFGNPGRCDDGLGPALAERLSGMNLPGVTVDSDYQLTVEDAHTVASHAVTIFADADVSGPEPFRFTPVEPGSVSGFSSHSVEPPEVVALAECLFGARVHAYALGIRGYNFNSFGEQLSKKATNNMEAALEFLVGAIRNSSFDRAVSNGRK